MTFHLHHLTRRSIRRLFEGPHSPSRRLRIFDAVRRCDTCAAYYLKYQTMESALAGTDDPYTTFSMERTGAALFAAMDLSPSTNNVLKKRFRVLVPVAVSVAVLFFVGLLRPFDSVSDRTLLSKEAEISPVTLVARGSYPKKAEADVGIRLFRVTEDGKAVTEEGALSINDVITFTYTQMGRAKGNLSLFGVQESGEIKWYYPGYQEETSISIEGDKVDEPLKDGILLSVNHQPGRLRITALFTDEPLAKTEIERAVSQLGAAALGVQNVVPIGLLKSAALPLQHSVIVEIGEGK